jgi:hypothetical protein
LSLVNEVSIGRRCRQNLVPITTVTMALAPRIVDAVAPYCYWPPEGSLMREAFSRRYVLAQTGPSNRGSFKTCKKARCAVNLFGSQTPCIPNRNLFEVHYAEHIHDYWRLHCSPTRLWRHAPDGAAKQLRSLHRLGGRKTAAAPCARFGNSIYRYCKSLWPGLERKTRRRRLVSLPG